MLQPDCDKNAALPDKPTLSIRIKPVSCNYMNYCNCQVSPSAHMRTAKGLLLGAQSKHSG